MERAIPNILVLFASLSLWTMALQASSGDSDRILPSLRGFTHDLASQEDEVRDGMAGEKLLENGTPIIAAAAGHWF